VDEEGVIAASEHIWSKNVIRTAGVTVSPAGKDLGVEMDRAGRVKVGPDLTIPGHPEIFVVGGTAHIEENGKMLRWVAQVAMQGSRSCCRWPWPDRCAAARYASAAPEALVAAALDRIPAPFAALLANVAVVVVEDEPDADTRAAYGSIVGQFGGTCLDATARRAPLC
jgi:hypothetical protein